MNLFQIVFVPLLMVLAGFELRGLVTGRGRRMRVVRIGLWLAARS